MSMDTCSKCGETCDTDDYPEGYREELGDKYICESCWMSINDEEMVEMFAEYQDEQALPPHKRKGYAEMMYELADIRRKTERENGL